MHFKPPFQIIMKVYNQPHQPLTPQLNKTLDLFRKQRNFCEQKTFLAKQKIINHYFESNNLTTAVVACSGGIDSAITLALIYHASQQKESPIQNVVPVFLPAFTLGATNQTEAQERAEELCRQFNLNLLNIDITSYMLELKNKVDKACKIEGGNWAEGQLVAYARTPALYYITSLYSQQKQPAIICGTINRDEGAYLGYVGKASDGMVDVQIISDLHKSEIYKLAEHLHLPQSIIQAIPAGDMYDGRTDVEVFGAEYDFVELYLHMRVNPSKHYTKEWSETDWEVFNISKQHLEKLHIYNKHKYLAGSVAVHLNVLESNVPGGWDDSNTYQWVINNG